MPAVTLMPLFVYGTLRDSGVLADALGHAPAPNAMRAAVAPGFRAVRYPLRDYPALVACPDAAAMGLALHDLTAIDLARLDDYEGDEYRRTPIAIETEGRGCPAWAYLPAIPVAADAPGWSFERWNARHRQSVLDDIAASTCGTAWGGQNA